MAKAITVASWNVEHFHGEPAHVDRVVSHLKERDPDVFTLYEVTGKEVFTQMVEEFSGYTFQITEGRIDISYGTTYREPVFRLYVKK